VIFNLGSLFSALLRLISIGERSRFLRPVPCGNSDQVGSAMNDSAQLLVVSPQGTGLKKQDLSPMAISQSRVTAN